MVTGCGNAAAPTPAPGPLVISSQPITQIPAASPNEPQGSGPRTITPGSSTSAPAPPVPVQVAPASATPVADPTQDRIQSGIALPVPLPASAGAMLEVEGGAWVGGSGEFALAKAGEQGIRTLAAAPGMTWVHVLVEPSNKKSSLGKSVAMAERIVPPLLQDDESRTFEASGFIYTDAAMCKVWLDPVATMRGLSQAPVLLATRSDQRLWLLFKVPSNARITKFFLGKKAVLQWEPAILVK